MRSMRLAAIGIMLAALAACGGGGGGATGGTDGGGLTVGASSLTFSMPAGGPAPASQNVAVTVTNPSAAYAGAAYGPGVTPASWLSVQILGAAPNYTFQFSANPTGLSVGTYTTTISIGMARSDGSIIAHQDVGVTLTVAASLNLSSTALTFSYAIGAAAPPLQSLAVSGNGSIGWTATADQSWVTLNGPSGTTPTGTYVGVNPNGLAPGTYTANITVSGGGDTKKASVALTVAAPAIAPSQSQLTFAGVNGATLNTQTLGVALNNGAAVSWSATSSAPWLALSVSNGTTPQTITVAANPTIGPLASGAHNATISLSATYAGTTLTSVVSATLTLTLPTLAVSTPTLVLGGTDGSDTTAVNAQLSLNTGSNAFPWSVSGLGIATHAAPLSGSVSSSPITLAFQPVTNILGNTYTSTATFTATVNGDVVTCNVPITVRIKPHHLFVHEAGVALMSSPGLAATSASITVRENRGMPIAWTATSDQTWLSLTTASGTTPGTLQMSADPSSLPLEAVSYANVTVTSTDPTISGSEVIHVGLYRTAVSPASQTAVTIPAVQKFTGIAADPVRPYAYLTHGTTTVEVHNIYTGALVTTITATASSDLRSLAVSDDGSRLYVADHGTASIRMANINPLPTTFAANWSDNHPCATCSNPYIFADLDYTRVNGRGVLIGGGVEFFDASDGTVLIDSGTSFFASSLAASVSGDGSLLFTSSLGSSGHFDTRQTLAFDELNNVVSAGTALSVSKDGASRGVSTDYTGSVVYRACWYQDQTIERYDGTTLATLSSVTSGTNGGVILGPGGYGYCVRYYDDYSNLGWPDAWAVDPSTGTVIAGRQYNVTDTILERQFVISGDGLRLITRSQATAAPTSGTLTSTTIGP